MQEVLRNLGVNINVTFHLIFLLLIWIRVMAMAVAIPYLFGKPVPRSLQMGAALAIAVFVYAHIVPSTPPKLEENMIVFVGLFMKEAMIGVAMGFMSSIVFHAMSSVGQMIDNQRGVSIARSIIPQLGEQASITGIFLFQFAVVLFLSLGGHDIFLDGFCRSFVVMPVLEFPTAGPGMFPLVDLFIRLTGEIIFISMQVAMPVIIAILLADLVLGIANRIAPQINVWMLGFTLKGSMGLLMLFISITAVADQMGRYTLKSNEYVNQTVELLRGQVPEDAPTLEPVEEKPLEEVPSVKSLP